MGIFPTENDFSTPRRAIRLSSKLVLDSALRHWKGGRGRKGKEEEEQGGENDPRTEKVCWSDAFSMSAIIM